MKGAILMTSFIPQIQIDEMKFQEFDLLVLELELIML